MSIFKVPSITNIIFSTTLPVRIYDINYGNHLGHDSLVSLLHEARVRFLTHHGYSELAIQKLGILVTNLAINYIGEGFYGEDVTIHIGVGRIGQTSVDLIYHAVVSDKNKEIARGLTTITFYDFEKKKVAKIPGEFLVLLDLDK